VFCGEPLMNGVFSKIEARAKIVDGETSSWLFLTALRRLSAVSLTPLRISA